MPGTTSSVPSPNYIKVGNTGQDQLGVGVAPGTQRAHVKSIANEVSLLVEQTFVTPTNDVVQIQTNAITDPAFGTKIPADTNDRLKATTAGVLSWGPGNATQDANLYRTGVGALQTDTALTVGTNLTVSGTATVNKTTDVTAFLAAYTTTTNTTNAAYKFTANGATGKFKESSVTGDTNPRFSQTAAGVMTWGPGNATTDTNLFRQAADTLRTDDSLQIGANLTVTGTSTFAGVVTPTSDYTPQDHGISAWTYDPAIAVNGTTTVSGRVYLARVPLRFSATVSKVAISIASAAVTVVANQNFLGIYDSTGTRVAVTAAGAIDAAIASSGVLIATLSSSPTLAAGFYWVGFVNNATTPAQIGRTSSFESTPNVNLTNANYRFAVNGASQTTLPASITPASNTSSNSITFWAAIL